MHFNFLAMFSMLQRRKRKEKIIIMMSGRRRKIKSRRREKVCELIRIGQWFNWYEKCVVL